MGFTVQYIFRDYLGSEKTDFVWYHIRRTTLTVVIHSLLIGFYCALLCSSYVYWIESYMYGQLLWNQDKSSPVFYASLCVLILCIAWFMKAVYWCGNNFERHPVSSWLGHFPNEEWRSLADKVARECRQEDTVVAPMGNGKIVVTDSWLIDVKTYEIFIAFQRDIDLSIVRAENIVNADRGDPGQILFIKVSTVREGCHEFTMRLKSVHYNLIDAKLGFAVRNAKAIIIVQSLSDQFIGEYEKILEQNRTYVAADDNGEVKDDDYCVGCMTNVPEVKLVKQCLNEEGEDSNCQSCLCPPMWCKQCLGKWFVSKQNANHPEAWLGGTAPW
eukprot:Nk52_evm4s390 gene=Nk52_evmTU4s390